MTSGTGRRAVPAICSLPEEAAAAIAAGIDVVLIIPPGPVPDVGQGLPGAGRLAVVVGDPGTPADQAAAQAMADELFGGAPRRA
ncbi:MAG: hypothetical protein ACRDXE_08005 [Acidimicrobiales bacterium]